MAPVSPTGWMILNSKPLGKGMFKKFLHERSHFLTWAVPEITQLLFLKAALACDTGLRLLCLG